MLTNDGKALQAIVQDQRSIYEQQSQKKPVNYVLHVTSQHAMLCPSIMQTFLIAVNALAIEQLQCLALVALRQLAQ